MNGTLRTRRQRNRANGFTLLEVLMAITLLGVLMIGVFSGLTAATQAVRVVTARSERLDAVRGARAFLGRELALALPLPYVSPAPNGKQELFDGASDRVVFVAALPGYLAGGGPYVQSVRLVDAGTSHALVLNYVHWMGGATRAPVASDPQELLLSGVRAARFEYRGTDEQGQFTGWVSSWPHGARLPAAVRVEVALEGRDGISWPLLAVSLRRGQSPLGALATASEIQP